MLGNENKKPLPTLSGTVSQQLLISVTLFAEIQRFPLYLAKNKREEIKSPDLFISKSGLSINFNLISAAPATYPAIHRAERYPIRFSLIPQLLATE